MGTGDGLQFCQRMSQEEKRREGRRRGGRRVKRNKNEKKRIGSVEREGILTFGSFTG